MRDARDDRPPGPGLIARATRLQPRGQMQIGPQQGKHTRGAAELLGQGARRVIERQEHGRLPGADRGMTLAGLLI